MTASKTIKFTSIFEKVNSFKFKKLAPAIAGTERKNEILAESYRSKLSNLPAVITIPALLTPGINASTWKMPIASIALKFKSVSIFFLTENLSAIYKKIAKITVVHAIISMLLK